MLCLILHMKDVSTGQNNDDTFVFENSNCVTVVNHRSRKRWFVQISLSYNAIIAAILQHFVLNHESHNN